jgi:hypothetical protein
MAKAAFEVLEVGGIGRCVDDFVDDREEVAKGADGYVVLGARAEGSAGESEDESFFDDVEADLTMVESEGGAAIVAKDVAGGTG